MERVGAVILRTGTLCCAPHRLVPYAVHCTDWHNGLCTAQAGTLCCAPHRLAQWAVHRTGWYLMLCTAQTGTLCDEPQTGSPYMYVQEYQRILRRRFPSLSSAIPGDVRADCQSADAVPFQTL
jgi:hypothetical protein